MLALALVLDRLEEIAPTAGAPEWDNVGLLLGDRDKQIHRIMTCLTVTPESADEAIAEKADLIVTHHPVLFRPVQRLTSSHPEGRMLLGLLQAGIAVYSPHTAFDNARGGINDTLADRLELADVVPLRPAASAEYKIVVFLPESDLNKVADAMFAAGAGQIGQYRECSFRVKGTGTFFGEETTNPTVGRKGRREQVSEWRLEIVCPQARVDSVVTALRKAHSYEEPAFDVYSLRPGASALGEGRVGQLPQPVPLGELARHVKQKLSAQQVQIVGAQDRPVQRVAIACGAGGELLGDALRARAEVFLTGELRFHDFLAAAAQELALLLPGHYATERPAVEELAERLQQHWPQLHVWASKRECDPATWV